MAKTYVVIATAAGAIAVFLFSLFPVTDFDIWFHLAEGKLMIQDWYFPYTDVFSYTAQGAENFPNSWGFTAFSYIAYTLVGLQGLNIIKALVVAAAFLAAVWFFVRNQVSHMLISVGFLAFAFFAVREGFSLRPHTFSYLFFVLFWVLLLEYKKHRRTKWVAALGITQFLWTNMHASFVFGPVLTFFFIADEFAQTKKLTKQNLLLAGTVGIASLLHMFYGASYIARIAGDMLDPATSRLPVRDLLRATPDTFLSPAGIVLLAAIPLVWWSIKTRQWFFIAAFVFFAAITLWNARFVRELVLFVALTAPLSFVSLAGLSNQIKRKVVLPSWALKAVFIAFLLILFFAAKTSALGVGLGLAPFTYPTKAVEFLRQNQILERTQGNLYHTYNFGGYLMWANQPHPIFIDGRVRPYHGQVFASYWTNFEGGETWQKSIGQYNITSALMTLPHTDGKTVYNNSTPMFPKKEWALVYYDDVASIYVRRLDELAGFIAQHEYKVLNPQSLDLSYLQEYVQSEETFQETVGEIQRALAQNPNSYRLHFTLAYMYSLAGLSNQMQEELKKTLDIHPHFQQAKDILNQL